MTAPFASRARFEDHWPVDVEKLRPDRSYDRMVEWSTAAGSLAQDGGAIGEGHGLDLLWRNCGDVENRLAASTT